MGDGSSANPVVLNYFNSLLRRSDLDLLENNNWLNDNLIGFYYEYLENDIYPDMTNVSFIGPDVAQLVKLNEPHELAAILESLDLTVKDFIFLPVNNNHSLDDWGGSHWSLLMYVKKERSFFHYDSFGGANGHQARLMANRLQQYFSGLSGVKTAAMNFVEANCPQQQNCCDCGVYVICITEQLCHRCLKGDTSQLESVVTPGFVSNKRPALRKLITELTESPV